MKKKTRQTAASLPVTEKLYNLLFDSTDQGFALLEKLPDQQGQPSDYRYLKVNLAYEHHSGLKNVIGKTIREMIPGVKPRVVEHYDSVVDTGQKMQFEEYVPEMDSWLAAEVFPTGISGTIALLFNDISERKRIEAKLQESEERQTFLLKLSDALRDVADPVEVQAIASRLLGEHLGANQVHYGETSGDVVIIHQGWGNGLPPMIGTFRQLDFGKRLTEGYQAGRIQISYDIHADPNITESERNVISGAGFNAYVAVPLIKNGHWVSTLAVHSIVPRKWKQNEIELVQETAERTWDAVKRARAEKALQENERLLAAIFGALPVGVGLINPDGTISMSNKEMYRYLPDGKIPSTDENLYQQWHAWDEQGKLLERQDFPGARALRGEYVLPGIEMLYMPSDRRQVWTQVASVPVIDQFGGITGQRITVITDIDKIKRTTEALRESERQFRTFVAASSDLIYRMNPDWQVMQTLSGKGFLVRTDHPIDNWLEVYIPKDEQARVRASIEEAIRDKKMFELEHRVNQADGSIGWTLSRAVPLLNEQGDIQEWLGAASDITFRKMAQEQLQEFNAHLEQEVHERTAQLQESRDQLQSVFDTTLMQMSILQAVRDEQGQVMDLEVKLVNKEHERVLGRTDLVGKLFVKEYPGMKQSVLFDLIVKTIETGEPQQTEYYYPHEGFNSWYSTMFVKLNDGVVAVNMNITARKQAEEERFKNYLLLQQSEDLALLGNWDYDLLNGTFTWSDGMYRLFNLEKGTEIQPEVYLRYATEAGRPAAERVVAHLRRGDSDFEETLEINVSGRIKVLHLKATVVKNQEGHPVRVLGVDMDVTAMRATEERIRRIEAEQQLEIFRVSLNTVEEERHRISESLHNGLGQLLYGIKINFSGLSQTMAQKTFEESKTYTNQLLTDAIKESRRISHELMPTMLEEFGLNVAIDDVCQQLQDGTRFTCVVGGFRKRLDKYLELAVYRTVQELMTNVIKHAQATEARTEVTGSSKEVKIRVSDNGRGMEASKGGRPGIGLTSIHSKIKLLNGKVTIRSDAGSGTTVEIVIPRPKVQLWQ